MKKTKVNKYKKNDSDEIVKFVPQYQLDYHDFGPLTAFEIEKYLNEFLEDSYNSKLKYVLVVTGKGKVVRPAVLKLLKESKFVESFKTAGYYTGQSGAFEVTIRG